MATRTTATVDPETLKKIQEAKQFISAYQRALDAGQTADELAEALKIDRKRVASKKNQFQTLLNIKFKALKPSGHRGKTSVYTDSVKDELKKLAVGLAK